MIKYPVIWLTEAKLNHETWYEDQGNMRLSAQKHEAIHPADEAILLRFILGSISLLPIGTLHFL